MHGILCLLVVALGREMVILKRHRPGVAAPDVRLSSLDLYLGIVVECPKVKVE